MCVPYAREALDVLPTQNLHNLVNVFTGPKSKSEPTAQAVIQGEALTRPVARGAQPPQLPRDRATILPLQQAQLDNHMGDIPPTLGRILLSNSFLMAHVHPHTAHCGTANDVSNLAAVPNYNELSTVTTDLLTHLPLPHALCEVFPPQLCTRGALAGEQLLHHQLYRASTMRSSACDARLDSG